MGRFLAMIMAIFCLAVSAHAAEQGSGAPCVVHTDIDTGPEQFLDDNARWNCNPSAEILQGPRVWVLFNPDKITAAGKHPVLNFHAGRFEGFHLYQKFADGRIEHTAFDAAEPMRFTYSASDFRIPIGLADEKPTHIALALDQPYSIPIVSRAHLLPASENVEDRFIEYGSAIFSGAGLMVLLFNIIFYQILRERFLIWHQIMIFAALTHLATNSGLFFEFFSQIGVSANSYISQAAFSLAVLSASLFARNLIEPGKLSPRIDQLLYMSAIWVFIAGCITLAPIEFIRPFAQKFYYLSFLPVLGVYSVAIFSALKAGSRAARFQMIAWLPVMVFGFERILRAAGLYEGAAWFDYLMHIAIAFELVISSIGAADRFMAIKQQRDQARNEAKFFAERSNTDPLTNLPNRRDFEYMFSQNLSSSEFDQLAIIDLDHFKSINDRFGHNIGDEVLRAFAREAVQHGHYVARIGGEEFAMLLNSRRPGEVRFSLDQFREAVSKAVKEQVSVIDVPVTVSIGCAPIAPGMPVGSALELADKRLYAAKQAGRNRVIGGEGFESILAVA